MASRQQHATRRGAHGARYLAVSGSLSAVGITVLVSLAPAWRPHANIGWGVLLSHVFVTATAA